MAKTNLALLGREVDELSVEAQANVDDAIKVHVRAIQRLSRSRIDIQRITVSVHDRLAIEAKQKAATSDKAAA